MPVPQAPRRAAPPRKRAAKSPAPAQRAPEPETLESPAAQEPVPDAAIGEKSEEVGVAALEELSPPHGDGEPEVTEQAKDIVEEVTAPDHPESTTVEVESISPGTTVDPIAPEPESELKHDELVHSTEPIEVPTETHAEDTVEETGLGSAPESAEEPLGSKEVQEAEAEEDEEVRRKRIAERIARSGGFNPFAGGMPPPPPPMRRDSADSVRSPRSATSPLPPPRRPSQHDDESRPQPPPQRRESVGSVQEAEAESPVRKRSMDGN